MVWLRDCEQKYTRLFCRSDSTYSSYIGVCSIIQMCSFQEVWLKVTCISRPRDTHSLSSRKQRDKRVSHSLSSPHRAKRKLKWRNVFVALLERYVHSKTHNPVCESALGAYNVEKLRQGCVSFFAALFCWCLYCSIINVGVNNTSESLFTFVTFTSLFQT